MRYRAKLASVGGVLLLTACMGAPIAPPDAMREELFAVERSFARASTERGIRASFLEYFAQDGIDFRPGPGLMRERMLARTAPADPLAFLLDWSPQAGAVARAGARGVTTGPNALRNQRDASAPTQYGYFFSVWKRENGTWRVALDAGVSTPASPAPDSLQLPASDLSKPPPRSLSAAIWRARGKEALFALERDQRSLDPEPADAPAYFDLLASSVRLFRDGSYALLGADAVRKALAAQGSSLRWTPEGGGVAGSDDLGYTYGSYVRVHGHWAMQESAGYYVHVWQRDDAGTWRIAAEVLLPLRID
jgi:ketosteroid isomerase-like protein